MNAPCADRRALSPDQQASDVGASGPAHATRDALAGAPARLFGIVGVSMAVAPLIGLVYVVVFVVVSTWLGKGSALDALVGFTIAQILSLVAIAYQVGVVYAFAASLCFALMAIHAGASSLAHALLAGLFAFACAAGGSLLFDGIGGAPVSASSRVELLTHIYLVPTLLSVWPCWRLTRRWHGPAAEPAPTDAGRRSGAARSS